MITTEQCLSQLVGLTEQENDEAFALAKGYIDVFVPMVRADRVKGERLLTDLKGQFLRRASPSPLRSEIIDFLDARAARLSDSEDDLDD